MFCEYVRTDLLRQLQILANEQQNVVFYLANFNQILFRLRSRTLVVKIQNVLTITTAYNNYKVGVTPLV